MALLFFKYFYFPSRVFAFLRFFNIFAFFQYSFKYFLLSFKHFLLLSFKYFFVSFLQIRFCSPSNSSVSLQIFLFFFLQIFLLLHFKYFFAFLQRFLHYFIFYCFPLKLLSLLSFFNKIGMTKSYQLENQSI